VCEALSRKYQIFKIRLLKKRQKQVHLREYPKREKETGTKLELRIGSEASRYSKLEKQSTFCRIEASSLDNREATSIILVDEIIRKTYIALSFHIHVG